MVGEQTTTLRVHSYSIQQYRGAAFAVRIVRCTLCSYSKKEEVDGRVVPICLQLLHRRHRH